MGYCVFSYLILFSSIMFQNKQTNGPLWVLSKTNQKQKLIAVKKNKRRNADFILRPQCEKEN